MFFYLTKLINQRSKFTHVKWPSHMHVNKPSFSANHTLFVCLSYMFCLLRPKHLQHIMMMTDKCVCVKARTNADVKGLAEKRQGSLLRSQA